ncbi:hypothetical protein CRG98_021937 [Punica granatum]|uniref:Uncharacterized protein n=1 Tax=Punica granatum TaxID=22663 RepID=A0A2I0JMW3_PUNGR|nr:hypothetical protein CRG98_021937 [Punica granatum]
MLMSDSPVLFFLQTLVALVVFILLFRAAAVFFFLVFLFALCSDLVYLMTDLLLTPSSYLRDY